MSVLAIDTSSRQRTVVVIAHADGLVCRAEVRTDSPVGVALPRSIASLLDSTVTAVVVVIGPGSYTGLRAGMAAALGIAQARGLPLFGVGTLDVVAAGCDPAGLSRAWAAADAGRGAVYIAACEADGERWRVGAPRRVTAAALDLQGLAVLSVDALRFPNAVAVGAAPALARAAAQAVQAAPLDRDGLRAVYVG